MTEAMLTSESSPTNSQRNRDPNDALRLADKQHVLFGGTRVVSTARGDASNTSASPVLRTGFATSQGIDSNDFAGGRNADRVVGDVPPGALALRSRRRDGARRRTRGPDA